MLSLTYSQANADFGHAMDLACQQPDGLVIERKDAGSVVLMSIGEYKALQETFHMLHTPANAQRLLETIAQLNNR